MFRKHTRRAAKAAFAISIGVALLIGLTATAGSASTAKKMPKKPTIVIGTKNFTEEFILGQLYGQALAAKGFHVVYKGSFGSSELANTAIQHGKMNFYPEYTGIIALDLAQKASVNETFPSTVTATWKYANKYERKHKLALLKPTPFVDADSVTVLTSYATEHHLTKISNLKNLASFRYAGYPECQTRVTCLVGLQQIYGLNHIDFVPIAVSVYTMLDQNQTDSGDGFTTDPQQNDSKYTTLIDDKHIFGFENVAPVVSQKILKGKNGKLLAKTANKVSKLLTIKAMRAMDAAAYSQKGTPKQIAHAFLKANHLVK